MTYTVSTETLNSSIPYHLKLCLLKFLHEFNQSRPSYYYKHCVIVTTDGYFLLCVEQQLFIFTYKKYLSHTLWFMLHMLVMYNSGCCLDCEVDAAEKFSDTWLPDSGDKDSYCS